MMRVMRVMKAYLLERSSSLSAWIGACGFVAEILLHLGNVSTLMLVLMAALVVVPEEKVRALFAGWAQRLRDYNNE